MIIIVYRDSLLEAQLQGRNTRYEIVNILIVIVCYISLLIGFVLQKI